MNLVDDDFPPNFYLSKRVATLLAHAIAKQMLDADLFYALYGQASTDDVIYLPAAEAIIELYGSEVMSKAHEAAWDQFVSKQSSEDQEVLRSGDKEAIKLWFAQAQADFYKQLESENDARS